MFRCQNRCSVNFYYFSSPFFIYNMHKIEKETWGEKLQSHIFIYEIYFCKSIHMDNQNLSSYHYPRMIKINSENYFFMSFIDREALHPREENLHDSFCLPMDYLNSSFLAVLMIDKFKVR